MYVFFKKKKGHQPILIFLADNCPFVVPLFWISGDVSSGFQSQSGLPYYYIIIIIT